MRISWGARARRRIDADAGFPWFTVPGNVSCMRSILPEDKPEQWTTTTWKDVDLNDKYVDFNVREGEAISHGRGYFIVYPNDKDERLRITIWSVKDGFWINLVLLQPVVNCIAEKKDSDPREFVIVYPRP